MEHRLSQRFSAQLAVRVLQAGRAACTLASMEVGQGGLSIRGRILDVSVGQVVMLDLSNNGGMESLAPIKAMVIHCTGDIIGMMFEQRLPKSVFLGSQDGVARLAANE